MQRGRSRKVYSFFVVFCMYFIQHCCIFHPSDSTVSEDVGIEPSNPGLLRQWHLQSDALISRLDLNNCSASSHFGKLSLWPCLCICGIHLKEGGVIGCEFLFMCDNGDRGTVCCAHYCLLFKSVSCHAAILKMNITNTMLFKIV